MTFDPYRPIHQAILFDAAGNPVGVALDGSIYRLQTESSPREEPTFVAVASNVAVGNNKSLISVYNPSASTKTLRIREVRLGNSATTAVTGVAAVIGVRRFITASTPTGGSAVTIAGHDTANALESGVAARTGATISGEEATALCRGRFSTDEWGPGTLDVEGHQQSFMNYFPLYRKEDPQEQPIVLRPGEGLTVKFETNSTAGAFDVLVRFSQV